MTRFHLTSWFCKTLALMSLLNAGISLIGNLFSCLFTSGLYLGSASFSLIPIATNIFLWLFAEGIAAEMTGEDRSSETLLAAHQLGRLLLPYVGLWLLVLGFNSSGYAAIYFVIQRFSLPPVASIYNGFTISNLIVSFTQTFIGITLAFGPRLLRWFRSP